MDGLRIAPVEPATLEIASGVLVEAARWLIDRGQPLWRPEDLVAERLVEEVEEGTLHLAWLGDEPAGTVSLEWRDPVFWPELREDDSAFVHRLAVRRHFAGSGVAPALLDWAAGRARAEGRRWLRLDCSDREGLVGYYASHGFERHSVGRLGDFSFVRFQRDLGVESTA